ncbi:hypothetical protein BDZ91DRAFT_762389 [Kalaharituber pfeilii]|nr:hypothetical protein BDZ91DRAFT_762389 [Kalaharituber pfeilii]
MAETLRRCALSLRAGCLFALFTERTSRGSSIGHGPFILTIRLQLRYAHANCLPAPTAAKPDEPYWYLSRQQTLRHAAADKARSHVQCSPYFLYAGGHETAGRSQAYHRRQLNAAARQRDRRAGWPWIALTAIEHGEFN